MSSDRSGARVLCCGTFDHFHPGHESFLAQAAALGSELFVVIARDENVKRIKGRLPDHSEEERMAAVEGAGIADDVRLGNKGANLLQVVSEIAPDVIALGYDQRPPKGLADAFPQSEIVTLKPHRPDIYKSSLFRRGEE